MRRLKSSTESVAISIISSAQMQKVGMVITHAIKFFLLISLILFSFVCFPCGSIVTDSFEVSLEFFPVAQLEEI